MDWIAVGETKAEKRIYAHNWTKRQAEGRKAKLDVQVNPAKVRFEVERLGFLDWRVIPFVPAS